MPVRGTLIALVLISVHGTRAGNTTCLNNSMDWFTQSVGETPCRIYEQLRNLCTPDFQVGNMSNVAPGDQCTGQVGACCCNTVAFALSMLCMSCQYGIGSGLNGDYGFDAKEGTYAQYLNNCGQPINETLPDPVQKAVCNTKLKIPSYVYRPSWQTTGAWFFEYTREQAQLKISNRENDTSSYCDRVLSNNGTSSLSGSITSSLPISTAPPPTSSGGTYVPKGAVLGIVCGGIALLGLGIVVGWFYSKHLARRRDSHSMVDLIEDDDKLGFVYEPYRPTTITAHPVVPGPMLHNGQGDSEWTYTDSSSTSLVNVASSTSAPAPVPPTPRRQKGGISPAEVGRGSARPRVDRIRSNNVVRTVGSSQLGSERPPSYEPRRSL